MPLVGGTQNADGKPARISEDGSRGITTFNSNTRKRGLAYFDDARPGGADNGKSAIVVTTMTVEQPGSPPKTKTVDAAVFDAQSRYSKATTELVRPKEFDNGALTADVTYETTIYEYDAASLEQAQSDYAAKDFSNASNVVTKTNSWRSSTNEDIDYGSGVRLTVEASTGETFTLESDGTVAGKRNEGTDFPEGTTFRVKQVTFDEPTGYDGEFGEYVIRGYGVLADGQNEPEGTYATVTEPGTVDVDIPFGIAAKENILSDTANIVGLTVIARETTENGALGTSISFQPTPGGVQSKTVNNTISVPIDEINGETLTVSESVTSVVSQVSTNVSVNVSNLPPDAEFPDGKIEGNSSGRSISITNTPPAHIHQDDDFIQAWKDIATAMTELAAITTELKGYTDDIKNHVEKFKILGTSENLGIIHKGVIVNESCDGGGLQPAVIIEALRSAGIMEDVLKEMGDPLYMPSGERESDKDA